MMRKIIITIIVLALLTNTLFITVQGQTIQFSDTPGHWAEEEIYNWSSKGLINGYHDQSFKPNNSITRAEYIALINRIVYTDTYGDIDFDDVSIDNWFYEDIAKAVALGYLQGYEDNTIRPNNPISREEVAVVNSKIIEGVPVNRDVLEIIVDKDTISHWSFEAVVIAVENGYMNGYEDNTLRPKDAITRAETLVTLTRVFQDKLSESKEQKNDFKVVAYYPYWTGSPPSQINYDGMTHINYAFAIPNEDGTIYIEQGFKLEQLVFEAHGEGVQVYIAIGGWGYDTLFADIASQPSKVNNFINSTMEIINCYNLDGVDMDWEYPDSGDEPENFVLLLKELSEVLDQQGKGLTAAINAGVTPSGNETWVASGIKDEAINLVDWLNIMVYDGQYGGLAEHHSSFEFAVNAIDYWTNQRQVPREKIILGVPFYGRALTDHGKSYKQIIVEDPSGANMDYVDGYYYNGIQTIQDKTQLALNQAGGIMIWEITQDTSDDTSLYQAIIDTLN